MGVVSEAFNHIWASEVRINWFLVIIFWLVIVPIIIAVAYFMAFPYSTYKLMNYFGQFDFPRPGAEGERSVNTRIGGGFTNRPDLGEGKATVPFTITRDMFEPGNEGLFMFALVVLPRGMSVSEINTRLVRDSWRLKIEGWPILQYREYDMKMEMKETVDVARQQIRPDWNEMTSAKHAVSHAASGWGGTGIGLMFLEYLGGVEGWLLLLAFSVAFFYPIPRLAWWQYKRKNPIFTKEPQPFKALITCIPRPEQRVQAVIIYIVPLLRPILLTPLRPDEDLLRGVAPHTDSDLPEVKKREEVPLKQRKEDETPYRVMDDSPHPTTIEMDNPELSARELSAALVAYFKANKVDKIKKTAKDKERRHHVTAEVTRKRVGGMKWSHTGKCEVDIVESDKQMTVNLEWKMKYHEGGADLLPRPLHIDDVELPREDELFWEAKKELNALKKELRPGSLERLIKIMDWSWPKYIGRLFQRLETDLAVWIMLGFERKDEKEKKGGAEKAEVKEEIVKKAEAFLESEETKDLDELVQMFASMEVSERIQALIEMELVAPGTVATATPMTIHEIEEFMVEKQGTSHLIVGGDPLTHDGHIVTKRNDLGSPRQAAASYMGFSEQQEENLQLRYELQLEREARRSSRMHHLTGRIQQVADESNFEFGVMGKLNEVIPTERRILFRTLGADTIDDVKMPSRPIEMTPEWPYDVKVKIPLNESTAKALRKKVSGIQDLVAAGVYLAVIRDRKWVLPEKEVDNGEH